MADNTTLNPGALGDDVRTIDKAGKKAQVVILDLGGAGAESLLTTAIPVSGTITETNSTAILADTAAIDTATAAINAKLVTGTVIGDVNLGATDNAVLDSIVTQLTVGAASVTKAEDAVHVSGDAGVMALAVRNDTLAALAGLDGDYAPLQVSATGGLYVTATAGAAQIVDDAAFTPATTSVVMVGAEFDDTLPDSVDEGDAGAVRMSANRNLYNTIRDAAGNERGVNVSAGNALLVDASATTQPVSAASLPLPSGAATAAAQLADGHNVTVDNAAGASAVNIQDGGNSITVDGTFFQATQPVSLVSVPSHAVTNAGTFATQVDGAALTALQLIDNAVSGAGFNITQMGSAAVPIGAGVEATAVRVTLPTDGTGVVNSTPLTPDTVTAVTVAGTGLTTLATIANTRYKTLTFHFAVATQNLDDFDVTAKAHASATLQDFTPTDWTILPAGGRITEASANLAAIAAAGNGYFSMNITGLTSIVITCSAVADSASVTPYWSLQ